MNLPHERLGIETVELRLRVLSPIHIGHNLKAGTSLAPNAHDAQFVVVDQSRLARALVGKGKFDIYESILSEMIEENKNRKSGDKKGINWNHVFNQCNISLSDIRGTLVYDAPAAGAFPVDANMHAVLPGSSIKGAIRTALAWQEATDWLTRVEQLGAPPGVPLDRFAFRRYPLEPGSEDKARSDTERGRLRGTEAINDLLRAVICRDLVLPDRGHSVFPWLWKLVRSGDGLWMLGKTERLQAKMCLMSSVIETTSLRVDTKLASRFADAVLSVRSVLDALNAHSRAVWEEEKAYWAAPDLALTHKQTYPTRGGEMRVVTTEGDSSTRKKMLAFYDDPPPADVFLLRVGWGQGLLGATALQALPTGLAGDVTRQAVRNRQMNRGDDPAPKSRRIASWEENGITRVAPFGWATLEYEDSPLS